MINFFDSGSFLDDIHFHYYFAKNPSIILSGDVVKLMGLYMGVHPPLYPYLLFPFTLIINDISAIIIAFFFYEALSFFLLLFLNIENENKSRLKWLLYLFILSPITWLTNIIWVQDEIIMAFFILVIIYLRKKEKDNIVAFLLGLSLLWIKFFIILLFIPYILTSKRPLKKIFLMGIGLLPYFIFLLYRGYFTSESPFLAFFGTQPVTGINIPNLIYIISNFKLKEYAILIILIIYFIYYLYILKSKNLKKNYLEFSKISIITFFIFFLFYARTEPEYFILFYPVIIQYFYENQRYNLKIELIYSIFFGLLIWLWQGIFALWQVASNLVPGNELLYQILQIHDNLIGNEFLKLEELIVIIGSLILIIRYLIIIIKNKPRIKSDLNLF
ncbi:MAG: hypothetical protein ACTSQP_23900 [Promethearchaeota archaeon]